MPYADGLTGYCCVMAWREATALAVYVGEESVASIYQIAEGDLAISGDLAFDMMMLQDCLMCSFEKGNELEPVDLKAIAESGYHFKSAVLPLFRQYKPGYVPWFISDSVDRQRLTDALLTRTDPCRRYARHGFLQASGAKHGHSTGTHG
jgi:hypothetical protein